MDKKKAIIWMVVIGVVLGGIGFYAGTKHASASRSAATGAFTRGGGAGGFTRGAGGAGAGGGLISGQVIAVDATSITIQERDGSSKVVFFTAATPVMEMVAGKASDIAVGKQVNIVGTTNSDGSISASSVQLRPAMAQNTTQTGN